MSIFSALEVAELLAELLESSSNSVEVPQNPTLGPDAIVTVGGHRFVVEYKNHALSAVMARATQQALLLAERWMGTPLIVVPYMGEAGRRICAEAGISWLDLSGNAHIKAEGLLVRVAGQPNRFKERGRPENLFAPKSSRLVRWLLSHDGPVSQAELSRATGLAEGVTSRLVARLLAQDLIRRDDDHRIRVRDRGLLLDAWCEAYDFSKHSILKGHIAARTSEALLEQLAKNLEGHAHAFTGLPAAWQFTHFAGYRLTTLYLEEPPTSSLLATLGFRETQQGANTWLVVPNDAGVFEGARDVQGVRCVHPAQVYVDLKAQPERATEAAEALRPLVLTAGAEVDV